MSQTLEYPYRPKPGVMLLATGFFLVCTLVLAYSALSNDRGLIIDSFITLDTGQATGFYWLLSVLSAGLVVMGLMGLRLSFMTGRAIVLSATELTIPASPLGQTTTVIPLGNIRRLSMQTVKSSRFLRVEHIAGKADISQRFFESKDRFEDFVARLQTAVGGGMAPPEATTRSSWRLGADIPPPDPR